MCVKGCCGLLFCCDRRVCVAVERRAPEATRRMNAPDSLGASAAVCRDPAAGLDSPVSGRPHRPPEPEISGGQR